MYRVIGIIACLFGIVFELNMLFRTKGQERGDILRHVLSMVCYVIAIICLVIQMQ